MNAPRAVHREQDLGHLAEQSVLGGLLLDNQSWDRIADIITADDFYRREHRLIFNAISALCGESSPADVVTVSEWLERSGEIESAGGLAYIGTLANNTPSAANIAAYADLVRQHAARRRRLADIDQARAALLAGDDETAARILRSSLAITDRPQLRAIALDDFLRLELPPRENLLTPWLPRQGLAMLYAPRGTGKTHVSLGIAHAIATGGTFLGWRAPRPGGVLFVDGEMPAGTLQERLAAIVASAEFAPAAPLKLLTPDLQPAGVGMPDLATTEGQSAIDAHVGDDIALIVVDNLSALVRSGKENEGEGWQPVQTWALRHRAQGRSVLFVHHAGKAGQQRGTSRREDVLDTVIALRRPKDYTPEQGAAFEIHFEKARGVMGDDAAPIEARLSSDEHGRQSWTIRSLDDSTHDRVVDLARDGLSQADIAAELGIHKSNVSRHLARARARGELA
jgi:hypothetical protein